MDNCPGQGDPLPLLVTQVFRHAVEEFRQLESPGHGSDSSLDFRSWAPCEPEPERQILRHRPVRVQGIRREKESDVTPVWRNLVDHLRADTQRSPVDQYLGVTLYRPQDSAPTALVPQEYQELPVGDLQVEIMDQLS